MTTVRYILALWRARWPLLRLMLAASLLAIFVRDLPASIIRHQWAKLPGYDYLAEARQLCADGRYGEALVVADAGLAELDGPAHEQLLAERDTIVAERDSLLRRARATLFRYALSRCGARVLPASTPWSTRGNSRSPA